ncbi:MAG: alpha-1,2-fucosyltransferase [Lachnospiraceae bacterium]|nr:alpha-1,2-fucosyltransferase [Lachnospiraceae bacterium]MDD7628521.1 alpha-1,2-fucosyltransferase [Lachnospiraceae bacterium]MDY4120047.1 alpha-1,2-fucosyltransferase [Lachnospiraceae bacterium]
MIIIQVMGGLGNQLQQYALYRKFVRMGKETRLDFSWFDEVKENNKEAKVTSRNLELTCFDRLVYETCTREEKEKLTGSDGLSGKLRRKLLPSTIHWFHESKMYHPEIMSFEDMYLSGYFACEKYYSDILYDLREKIQFPPSNNPLNREMERQMRECASVSVHVRRGDYLNDENREMFGNICTDAYYQKAMELIKGQVPEAHFYIFSDDVSYVRQKYQGEEYTVVDINHGKDSFYDMWLMSNCKHNICANSTFSFWGARLNRNKDKIMIRPTVHKNTQVFEPVKMRELWENWTFIDKEGRIFLPNMS